MERWVTKIISLMKENKLFASQGGPIILSQVSIYVQSDNNISISLLNY